MDDWGMVSLFELSATPSWVPKLPRSGGEYYFLSRILPSFIGYLSAGSRDGGLCRIGCSRRDNSMAPYRKICALSPPDGSYRRHCAHLYGAFCQYPSSSNFQNGTFTALEIAVDPVLSSRVSPFRRIRSNGLSNAWHTDLSKPCFCRFLVYVIYAFSGWNAAAYIVEEIEEPARNLPRALIGGTLVVSLLYVLLQMVLFSSRRRSPTQG